MPITYTKVTARLTGVCSAEETPELVDWLQSRKSPRLDLEKCEHLHTAVLQALLSARPTLSRAPRDPCLAQCVGPLFLKE